MRRWVVVFLVGVLLPQPMVGQEPAPAVPDFAGSVLSTEPSRFNQPPFVFQGSRSYTIFVEHHVIEPVPVDYLAAYLLVPVSYAGEGGGFVPVLYLDGAGAITAGREIWGFNKRGAEFEFVEEEDAARIRISRSGTPIIEAGAMGHGEVLESLLPDREADPTNEKHSDPVVLEIMSDGLALQARLYRAEEPGARQTLLLLPGFPGNPEDVLGLGRRLSDRGINVLMLTPRGVHGSEGTFSFGGAMEDIGAGWRWLRSDSIVRRFGFDTSRVAMGGYSWGGGMALAYAARDSSVRRVLSIAGTDHGEFIRMMQRNPAMNDQVRAMLAGATSAEGPVRGNVEDVLEELAEGQEVYGLQENAAELADRDILLVGGWQDRNITIDDLLLPLYRALESAGADAVTFLTYHDGHGFLDVREELARDIASWLETTTPALEATTPEPGVAR